MRQATFETQTQTYEVEPREAARALDIQLDPASVVNASVKGGKIVFTVKTDRSTVADTEVPGDGYSPSV